MRKKIITTIVMIGMFLLVVTNVSALSLRISPGSLVLNGEPNTEICSKLTIESSIPNGIVEASHLWDEKDMSITYLENVSVLGSKDIDVCVTTPLERGLYYGNLIYTTIGPGGSVGIELKVKIIVDTITPYFVKDEPKEISAFQTVLEIITNEDVAGNVIISEYGGGLEGPDGKDLLGDLIEINAPEVENKLKSVTIKKYYTIEQLNENSLNEDSLKLYYYNNGNWEELDSDKVAKYVYATVDHFSIFGIFGNILGAPSKPVVVDDGDSTLSTTSLHAQWSSNSVGSDISEYMYAIGTSPEATNMVNWTSTTQTSVTKSGLSLNVGTTYYFSVQAKNDGGWSEVGVSNGIEIINPSSSGSSSSGSSSSSSNSNNRESVYNTIEDTIAKITGGAINLGGSKSDENNKGSGFLIIIPIILLILIALIVILSVKKSKKKVLSK